MAAHPLRQRAVVGNMRHAFDSERSWNSVSDQSEQSSYPQSHSESDRSYRTQPTTCSTSPAKEQRELLRHSYADRAEQYAPRFFHEQEPQASPTASVETYASTIASQEEEDLIEDLPEYEVPEYVAGPYETPILAATPSDFSELFPSHRKLLIRHDDTTVDGNLNLRLDMEVPIRGQPRVMTLFHLRMHDLKKREFSFRRYCRDSGREVCHSVRKHQKPAAERRPGIQRSLSHALNSMRSKSDSRTPTTSNLLRNDSGYGSMYSVDFPLDRPDSSDHASRVQQHMTHTIKLEFSNYAQVDVKRVGVKAGKRYEFEYWGVSYAWRRMIRRNGNVREISFQLKKTGTEQTLAYILPAAMSATQADEERAKGGWITPCSLWISDDKIVKSQKDLADVIISAGIIALVDNSIRERFQTHQAKTRVEYVGPKRLLSGMFRRGSTASSNHSRPTSSSGRPSTSSGPAPGSRPGAAATRHMSHDC